MKPLCSIELFKRLPEAFFFLPPLTPSGLGREEPEERREDVQVAQAAQAPGDRGDR